MCSSSSTPTFSPLHIPRTNRHFLKLSYPFPLLTHFRPTNPRTRKLISLSSSVIQDNLQLSWASSDRQGVEDYNGWAIVEESFIPKKQKKGLPTFVLFGIGTSVVALLAVFQKYTIFFNNYNNYARWWILVNSQLERNQRNRILPSVALAGSTINAFDDISAEDPDFEYIQALAEAGVVLSKLSGENLTSDLDSSKSSGGVNFFPKRLISREDLIGWRAKLEYQVMPGLNEEDYSVVDNCRRIRPVLSLENHNLTDDFSGHGVVAVYLDTLVEEVT